ncbi:hypothetical protein [Nocardia xishanensis]
MASLGMPSLPSAVTHGPDPVRKAALARRIRRLVAATITYHVIEAAVALTEGARVNKGRSPSPCRIPYRRRVVLAGTTRRRHITYDGDPF